MTIDTPRPSLLFVCTGNATRSVIAGELARRALPGARVATAGTFVVEGQVTSWRTRAAMDAIGITAPHHRSTQLTGEHLRDADLVVVLDHEHVRYVRRNHAFAAARTATLRRLVRDLPPGPGDLDARVAALALADGEPDPALDDVIDPGGREVEDFVACAHEIDALMKALVPLLGP